MSAVLGLYLGQPIQWSPVEYSQTSPFSPLDFLLLLVHCLCETTEEAGTVRGKVTTANRYIYVILSVEMMMTHFRHND